jgi:hypothetical protein
MKWVTRLLGVTLAVASLLVGGVVSQSVSATSSPPTVFINGNNTFYAYIQTGEKVNIAVVNSGIVDSSLKKQPLTLTVLSPGGPKTECTIVAAAPPNAGCGLSQLTAPKPGIWSFSFNLPDDAELSSTIPNQRVGANFFRWSVAILDSAGVKDGRFWSEQYTIRQPDSIDYAADMSLYYQSQDGYLYRANYKGYSGQLSRLSADAFGIVKKDTCVPAYKSVEISSKDFTPSYGKCGGNYKIFFEPPSDDLPVATTRWDGSVDWVRPAVDRPQVSGLKFTSSDDVNTQSGTVTFKLKNFIGQYEIKVDVNDDGNFDGAKDVTIPGRLKYFNDPGDQVVQYDGLNRDGNTVDKKQPIRIKLKITKSAEIHLVAANATGRSGGLALSRLSGDNAPSHNACWNDAELGTQETAPGETAADGPSCPDSLTGIHRWKFAEGWGRNRYIDDWAFSTAKVAGTAEIRYVDKEVLAQQAVTRRNVGIGAAIVGVIVLVGIGVTIFWLKKRRNKHDDNNLEPPTQTPPSQPLPPFQDPPTQFPPMQDPPTQNPPSQTPPYNQN